MGPLSGGDGQPCSTRPLALALPVRLVPFHTGKSAALNGHRNSLLQMKPRQAGCPEVVSHNPAVHLNLPVIGLV